MLPAKGVSELSEPDVAKMRLNPGLPDTKAQGFSITLGKTSFTNVLK